MDAASTPSPLPARPRAREDVVFRRVGEDWVLFDPVAQEIHVLNLSAALVWTYCTGDHDLDDIEAEVRSAFGVVEETGVRDAVGGFRAAGLLQE